MPDIGTEVPGGTLKAIRTNCVTGQETTVELRYLAKFGFNHQWWFYIRNGVTGYESFNLETSKDFDRGWHACVGTPNRWDALWVSPDEIIKAIKDMKGILGLG